LRAGRLVDPGAFYRTREGATTASGSVATRTRAATLTEFWRLPENVTSRQPEAWGAHGSERTKHTRQYPMIARRSVLKCLTAVSIAKVIAAKAEASTMSEDGLITVASTYPVKETLDRLEADLKAKGITVFARIDHAAGAASVALPLRPTELLIFGSPKGGTPLMQANQTIGIDLPLKILGWEDAGGKVWITYNDPGWLARRHRLGPETAASVNALSSLLANLAKAAAG
jgi:uncharacterized protein (DUF302 family)